MARFCTDCGGRVDATGVCGCGAHGDEPTAALALATLTRVAQSPPTPVVAEVLPARLDLSTRTARRTTIATVVAFTLFLAAVGVGLFAVIDLENSAGTSPGTAGTSSSGRSVTTQAADTGDPAAALQARREADRSALAGGTGSWYPQISSKRVGTTVDGVTYDEAAIWRDFQAALARHPEARLAWTGDWDSFRQGGYWVTIIDLPSASARSANQWCDREGFPVRGCYAKRVTGSGGPDGNTVLRN